MSLSRATLLTRRLPAMAYQQKAMYSDDGSKDVGTGGGGAGAIREAGGAFGKREAALEEQYFRKLQGEQLAKLKSHVEKEINHHKEEISRHQEAIEKLKKRSKDLTKESEKK